MTSWTGISTNNTVWADTSSNSLNWGYSDYAGRYLLGAVLLFAGDGVNRYVIGGTYTAPTTITTIWN